jgi:hypothetical protein
MIAQGAMAFNSPFSLNASSSWGPTDFGHTRLISWRRGEKKFPETEAQRRARARERSTDSGWPCSRVDRLDVLTAVPPVELPEFDGDRLMEELDALAKLSSPTVEETLDASAGSSVSVDLSPEQSSALYALPLSSMVYGESVPHTLLQLRKAQDHRGMTLQFSLHTQVGSVPQLP